MLVDLHTHLALEKHFSGNAFFIEAERGGGSRNGFTADYQRHWEEEMTGVDKAVVFGLNARASGVVVPNSYIAGYANMYPEKVIGFSCVDPNQPDAAQELEYCIKELKLKGLKLGPIYQHFHPHNEKIAYPVYEMAQKLGIPVMWHMGTSFVQRGPLEYTRPALLEQIALDFPQLKMVAAHMGHPWEAETIVLIRKQPTIFADISALYYRPWQFYNMMVLALEYRVTHKMFFGTDFPVTTPKQSIEGIKGIKRFWEGTTLPSVPDEIIDSIIYNDSLKLLGIE